MPSSFEGLAKQERIRREISARCGQLQPLPDLVTKVLSLIDDPDTEPAELERHLSTDPVLVGKMIGMVNTPLYATNRPVTSVADAIMVIGFRGLRSMVLAASVASHLKRNYAVLGHTDGGLWSHSIAVATAARAIRRAMGGGAQDAEKLFVMGLMHDVGKMMTAPYLEQEKSLPEGSLEEVEKAVLGTDHAEVGKIVAETWNLDAELGDALAGHHGGAGDNATAAVLRLADDLAHDMGCGYEPGRAPAPRYSPADLELVGLLDTWDTVCAETTATVESGLASLDGLGV